MGQTLRKARDGVWPSFSREANSSSVGQQVGPIWWRDCLGGYKEKGYFEVGSRSGVGTGLGIGTGSGLRLGQVGEGWLLVRERKPAK